MPDPLHQRYTAQSWRGHGKGIPTSAQAEQVDPPQYVPTRKTPAPSARPSLRFTASICQSRAGFGTVWPRRCAAGPDFPTYSLVNDLDKMADFPSGLTAPVRTPERRRAVQRIRLEPRGFHAMASAAHLGRSQQHPGRQRADAVPTTGYPDLNDAPRLSLRS